MRSYNEKQEEANWSLRCLLLPREALLRCKRRGSSVEDIAEEYGVSETSVRLRLRVTMVEAQHHASKAYQRR
jgi:hypothetical protein